MHRDFIFFTQLRTGLSGKPFTIFKFRTMYLGAEKDQHKLQAQNEGIPPTFKITNDPRLTRFGSFLSKIGLDEIPQLINIYKGEMAFFGPRPLPLHEAKQLPAQWRKKRQSVKPGIISSWTLDGGHSLTQQQWMALDLKDVDNLHSFSYRCYLTMKFISFLSQKIVNEFMSLIKLR